MANFTINWTDEHQSIDGFGACDRDTSTLTTGQLDLLFSQSSGIGLSLLRASIEPGGIYSSDPANAQGAVARGAKVWGAPWTPNPTWKSNGSSVGGTLNSIHYGDHADNLCSFVTTMATTYSVPIIAISAQNEPDSTVGFDSCQYSSAQMLAFIKVLGPKLAALSVPPLLMAPEVEQWSTLWGSNTGTSLVNYMDTILADATAAPMIGIVATHDYGYATSTHSTVTPRFWETEVSSFEAADATLTYALRVAGWIDRAMQVGNVNAWHWWNIDGLNDNEDLLPAGALTKKLYALGNWSKFIRPGWKRIGVTGTVTNVSVSAFKNAATNNITAVVINNTGSNSTLTFALSGITFGSNVVPYITSGTTIGSIGTDGNLSAGSVSAGVSSSITPTSTQVSVLIPPGITTLTALTTQANSISYSGTVTFQAH